RALKSVEKIVDEIVVVDTGSQDRTREVARKYGAKVIKTKWNNDFSAAKNRALSEASGDYVLFMDADEFIEARQRYPLLCFKAVLPPSRDLAFNVRVETEEDEEELSMQLRVPVWNKTLFQNRLLPNHREIQFKGRAFEDVGESLRNLGINVAVDDIFKITHGVSATKWRAERKRKAVLDSFSHITKAEYFFEAALYFLKLDDFDNAYFWLMKSNFNSPEIVVKIAILYLNKNQSERAKAIAQRGLQIWHENLELICVLSEIYFLKQQF
ncbi:unnamed protein product, partial [marine sediment metagenome]